MDMGRTLLFGFPDDNSESFWAEAINTATNIRDRLIKMRSSAGITHFELVNRHKPDVNHL